MSVGLEKLYAYLSTDEAEDRADDEALLFSSLEDEDDEASKILSLFLCLIGVSFSC
jgi:glucokinase